VRVATLEGYEGIDDAVLGVLDRAVKGVLVETAWGPPLYIPDPFRTTAKTTGDGGAADGAPGGFDPVRFLKPKITLRVHEGWGRDRVFAPYGDPGPSKFPLLVIGSLIFFGLGGSALFAAGRRSRR
jgi:hypothetical protein